MATEVLAFKLKYCQSRLIWVEFVIHELAIRHESRRRKCRGIRLSRRKLRQRAAVSRLEAKGNELSEMKTGIDSSSILTVRPLPSVLRKPFKRLRRLTLWLGHTDDAGLDWVGES